MRLTRRKTARGFGHRSRWLVAGGLALMCGGCLDDDPDLTNALTAFEAPSPADGQPRGQMANAIIDGQGTSGTAPSGGSSTGDGTAGSPADHPHSAQTHEEKPHKEAAAGEGSDLPAPTGDGSAAPIGTPETRAHEERVHRVAAPGEGSNLPPEGVPAVVPVPPGKGEPGKGQGPTPEPGKSGEPEKASPPQPPTRFEEEYEKKGKKMVVVSGELVYDGKTDAQVDIDCFVPDTSTPAGRRLVNKVKVQSPGPYRMKVPANFGRLIITAFIDLKANGPDPKDPQGQYSSNPLEVKDKDVSKIDVVLKSPGSGSP